MQTAGGHSQSDLDQTTLMAICRAAAWLSVFTDNGNPTSNLSDLSSLAHDAHDENLYPVEVVEERLRALFAADVQPMQLSRGTLYTRMVEVYQAMCEEEFGPALLQAYRTEDDHGSDPGEDSADQCTIPLPGELGEVRLRPTMDSECEDKRLDYEEQVTKVGGRESHRDGMTDSVPEGSDSLGVMEGAPGAPAWVTTRKKHQYTFAVVRRRDASEGDPTYTIWASRAYSRKEKGVKVVKTCHRLHVAKNYISQKLRSNGPIAERVTGRQLVIYNPEGKVYLRTRSR